MIQNGVDRIAGAQCILILSPDYHINAKTSETVIHYVLVDSYILKYCPRSVITMHVYLVNSRIQK